MPAAKKTRRPGLDLRRVSAWSSANADVSGKARANKLAHACEELDVQAVYASHWILL
jgi:hypothetical protein